MENVKLAMLNIYERVHAVYNLYVPLKPPRIIIDINFQAVNLKKDEKKFLISTTIFFLQMLVLSYQGYAHGVSYMY